MHPSILIVDDEKDNLKALQRLLKKDFEVSIAESAFEALKLVQKNNYPVILSDQRMPEMTGVEFFEKAKSLSPLSSRVLLTGYTDLDSVIDAINRGNVYRYISKPWDPEELKIILLQSYEAYRLKADLEKAHRELQESYFKLKALDEAKEKFIYLISHELKTPLTVLQSFGALLQQDRSSLTSDQEKAVSAIDKATERFSDIIEEVLLYTKVTTDGNFSKKDISWETFFKSLGVKIVGSASIQGDELLLKIAFEKFFEVLETRKETIEISAAPSYLVLEYSGESLTEDQFVPFVFTKPLLNHQKDLGLGLAIFKAILEKHAATLRISENKIEVNF